MLGTILVILVLLWVLGFLQIPGIAIHNIALFRILGHTITAWELIMFLVIAWAMETLPSPLRQIAYVLVLLWVLSIVGLIHVAGLSQMIIGAIIIGIIVALFQHH